MSRLRWCMPGKNDLRNTFGQAMVRQGLVSISSSLTFVGSHRPQASAGELDPRRSSPSRGCIGRRLNSFCGVYDILVSLRMDKCFGIARWGGRLSPFGLRMFDMADRLLLHRNTFTEGRLGIEMEELTPGCIARLNTRKRVKAAGNEFI